MGYSASPVLDDKNIRELLMEVGTELSKTNKIAEIAIYGGGALLLMFDRNPIRESTHDIDFCPISGDTTEVIMAAEKVGSHHGLEEGWFNDAVDMFRSDNASHLHFGDFPPNNRHGLRVFLA